MEAGTSIFITDYYRHMSAVRQNKLMAHDITAEGDELYRLPILDFLICRAMRAASRAAFRLHFDDIF